MNIFLNEYFGFCFELNFELNHFKAKFNEKMNFQNVSNRATNIPKLNSAHFLVLFLLKSRDQILLLVQLNLFLAPQVPGTDKWFLNTTNSEKGRELLTSGSWGIPQTEPHRHACEGQLESGGGEGEALGISVFIDPPLSTRPACLSNWRELAVCR